MFKSLIFVVAMFASLLVFTDDASAQGNQLGCPGTPTGTKTVIGGGSMGCPTEGATATDYEDTDGDGDVDIITVYFGEYSMSFYWNEEETKYIALGGEYIEVELQNADGLPFKDWSGNYNDGTGGPSAACHGGFQNTGN